MNMKSTAVPTALAGALLASAAPLYAADVTFERLLNPEPHNWLMVHHDYGAHRDAGFHTVQPGSRPSLGQDWTPGYRLADAVVERLRAALTGLTLEPLPDAQLATDEIPGGQDPDVPHRHPGVRQRPQRRLGGEVDRVLVRVLPESRHADPEDPDTLVAWHGRLPSAYPIV